MNKKILAISMVSIITLNAFPINIFKKTTHAASFVSNVSKIENPVPGGDNDNWSGNYIYFGHYPQSSSSSDEPIRWRILDNDNIAWKGSTIQENGFIYDTGLAESETDANKGGRQNAPVGGNGIFLLSDQNLDSKQYHPAATGHGEEDLLCWGAGEIGSGYGCTLWAWLNGYDNSKVLSNFDVPNPSFLTTAFTNDEIKNIMNLIIIIIAHLKLTKKHAHF